MSLTRIGRPSSTAVSDDALAQSKALRGERAVGIADGVRDPELFPRFVQQIHRKCVEAGEPRNELRDLGEQLLEVEHRHDFAPEIEQRGSSSVSLGGRTGG